MTVSILTAPALASGNMLLPEDVSGVNPQIAHPGGTLANANLPQQLLRAVGTLNSYRPTPTQISTPLPTLVPANPHPTETANPNPTPPAPGGNPTATPLPPAPTQPSAPTATPHGKKPTPPAPTPGPTSINPTPTATINPHKRGLAPAMNGQPASMIASPLPPFLQAVQAFFSQLLHLGQSGLPPASRQPSPTTDPLVIGFYVNGDDNADTSLQQNIQNLDRLMPVWLHLADANGTVADDNLAKENDVLDLIRQLRPNLPVVPLVNSYNPQTGQWNSQVLGQMLNNPAARDQTIQYLLQFVQNNHLAGISIDFEDAPLDSQKGLQAFMQSLYARFHPLNLEVTQVIPLANPSFDLQVYSQTADYLVLVGYDEHWSTAKPGPVASQGWLKTGLD
ncbi:MAG TPA: glycosyl hydrolase family 18 protein, partial [Anaerolineaceae bacterium]